MSKSKLEISKESGPHARLASLVGTWEGNTQTWFEKDILADESSMRGEITQLMDARFINYQYQGHINGKPFEGKMTWGYDLGNQECQCSWIDSFHMGTGIMHSKGSEIASGFTVLGSYGGEGIPEPWGWRTELEIISTDQFVLRAFNISPEGDEAKATETVYRRVIL